MNDNVENLILTQLKEIGGRLDQIEDRMSGLATKVNEGFDDQTQRASGIVMILTMLAGHVHAIDERVEKLEAKVR